MTRMLRSILPLLGAAALIASTACSSSSSAVTLSSIAVAPPTATVAIGHTQALVATGTFSDGSTATITDAVWTTSSATTATVSTAGLVTAKAAGSATITATSSGKSGAATITVPAPALVSIAATAATASLAIGGTDQITVTGTNDDGSHVTLTTTATYTPTPATGVVTVSSGGLITAVGVGTASIAVTAGGKTAPTPVAVTVSAPVLTALSITPSPVALAAAGTAQLTVTGTYDVGAPANLTSSAVFTIAPAGVATVSGTGLVTAVAANGTATITATVTPAGGAAVQGTVSVVVGNPVLGKVFTGGAYAAGVSFRAFGGTDNITVDASTQRTGTTYGSLKVALPVDVPGPADYTGGALVDTTGPRNLSAYDSVTFWAKASVALSLDVAGLGNNASLSANNGYEAEVASLPISTTWTKYIVPIPRPSVFTKIDGLFHFAIGNTHSGASEVDVWFSDIQYEALGSGVIGAPSPAWVTLSGSLSVGDMFTVQPTDLKVDYTINGATVEIASLNANYFTFAASNGFATVSGSSVTAVTSGSTDITAKLGTVAAAGALTLTISDALPSPTTLPPTPAQAAGANVISLYSSVPGGYNGTASDKSGNVDTWNTCWSRNNTPAPVGGGGEPFSVTVGANTAMPRKYVVGAGGQSYVGIEFLGKTGATQPGSCGGTITGMHELDVSAMDHFHIDVWTADDSSNFQVKLQDAGADGSNVSNTAGIATITAVSTPPLSTGTWLSYDLPLSGGFPGLSTFAHMGTIVLQAPAGATFYVDNLYFFKGSTGGGGSAPTTAATAPAADPAAALSLFSATYSGTAADKSGNVDSYDSPCFGPPLSGGNVADYTIPGINHPVKQYLVNAAPTYFIVELIGASGGTASPALCNGGTQTGANLLDASGMDTIHFDVWSPTGSGNFQVHLINAGTDGEIAGNGAPGAMGPGTDYASGANTVAASTWVPIDLKLNTLGVPAGGLNRLGLVKFFTVDGGTYFLDNIYFYNSSGPQMKKQMSLPVSFDDATVAYGLVGFGGAEDSTIAADPTNASNMVAKVNRSATAQTYAGTTVTTNVGGSQTGLSAKVPFTASATKMSLRTYTYAAGIHVRLKIEDHTNGGISVETEALTTMANAWETLTFDFSTVASGAPLNLASSYDKASVFFDFGKDGPTAGAHTYYFDDLAFGGGSVVVPAFTTLDFEDPAQTYTLTPFGGVVATVTTDPNDNTNHVGQIVKDMNAQVWAGATVSTGVNDSVGKIPFTMTKTVMTMAVYSPKAGIPVRLKVEDAGDPTHSCETEVNTTMANGWELLTFDFSHEAMGTAALNLGYTFNKVSVFMNFNNTETAATTYYFDEITFVP